MPIRDFCIEETAPEVIFTATWHRSVSGTFTSYDLADLDQQLSAQQQVLPPSPLPMIPAGLDGRTLTTSAQTGPPKPLAPPPVRQ